MIVCIVFNYLDFYKHLVKDTNCRWKPMRKYRGGNEKKFAHPSISNYYFYSAFLSLAPP